MQKHTTILRWLSLVPAVLTVFALSDWVVRLFFWFVLFPIRIFEKIGFSTGPIGRVLDNITNYLVGHNSDETLAIIATGLVTSYAVVYIPTIIAPASKKKTAKVLAVAYLILLALGFTALLISGITGENILWAVLFVIGILFAWQSVNNATDPEIYKHEEFIQRNIVSIFISTSLFAVLIAWFFLIV